MKAWFSEFLGTFLLVFCGTGAIIVNEFYGVVTHVGIAITFGLTVMVLIEIFGPISGAHFNPAVTMGFWIQKAISFKKAVVYILAQCAGALGASALYRLWFPTSHTLGATLPNGPIAVVFLMESILTVILMLAILRVSKRGKEKGLPAAVTIGSVVGLEALFAGPLTGASMNPARSLAPALCSGHTEYLWVYLLAPLFGVCVAVLLFKWINSVNANEGK